jgi:hypothetical protein
MALPLIHTVSRNISAAAIASGKYANLRIHGEYFETDQTRVHVCLAPLAPTV